MSGAIASTDSYTQGAVDPTLHTLLVTFYGSWVQNAVETEYVRYGFDWGLGAAFNLFGPTYTADSSYGFLGDDSLHLQNAYSYGVSTTYGGYNTDNILVADTTYGYRTHLQRFHQGPFGGDFIANVFGSSLYFKTNAIPVTNLIAGAATLITASTARITFSDFRANTVDSIGTCSIEYRKFGDSVWITAGSTIPGIFGYGAQSMFRDLTGLLGNTIYEYRLHVTRTTNNDTDFATTPLTFTTLPSTPDILTTAASPVGYITATLNGTVDPNTISVRVRFGWGTADGGSTPGSWANLTAYQSFSGDGVQGFSQAITGLLASTLYRFRAFVEYPSPGFGTTIAGPSTFTFTTSADPGVAARKAQMPKEIFREAKYGVARTFFFDLEVPAGTDPDRFLDTASPLVAGDVKVCGHTASPTTFVNVTTLPTRVDRWRYKWDASTAEMTGTDVEMAVVDQTGTAAFRDLSMHIETQKRWGTLDIDATVVGGNTPAMKLTGVGTSPGLQVAGGATSTFDISGIIGSNFGLVTTASAGGASTVTLGSNAVATDNWYNGFVAVIVSGVGAGQHRVIISYAGATKIATVDSSWVTNPDSTSRIILFPGSRAFNLAPTAELASLPAAAAPYGQMIQLVYQRFAFKIDQTSVLQTWYTSAGVALFTRGVLDNGATQTINKLS